MPLVSELCWVERHLLPRVLKIGLAMRNYRRGHCDTWLHGVTSVVKGRAKCGKKCRLIGKFPYIFPKHFLNDSSISPV
jgi:hypothetical protein